MASISTKDGKTGNAPYICHGCNGKGWVSPNGVTAVVCPVCTGTGVKKISQAIPATQRPSGFRCPNVGPNETWVCNCTGACMGRYPDNGRMWVE